MSVRKMELTDAAFLLNESRETPMHVGGLTLYTLPKGESETAFISKLLKTFRDVERFRPPFGDKLEITPLGPLGPVYLRKDKEIDIDYHVRHSALPKPGRFRELFELVSRLHSTLLDQSRPLWEFTIITGLANRQFATYFKIHHSVIDGMGVIHFNKSMFSEDPEKVPDCSPFSQLSYERYLKTLEPDREVFPIETPAPSRLDLLKGIYWGGRRLSGALNEYAQSLLSKNSDLAVPWKNVPKTTINKPISGARRYVAQSWSLNRVKQVSKAFGGTLNDGILAICSGALRRYLEEFDSIPKQPLKAMVPVSIRDTNDAQSSNAVTFFTANLATNVEDTAQRVEQLCESMHAAKQHLSGLKKNEIQAYTSITQAPAVVLNLSGQTSKLPPYNTVISNIPGPRSTMYLHRAKVDGIYPVSIPSSGFALNITVVSYDGNLDFGITACRRSVPSVQRLIDFMEDALIELEKTYGIS